MKNLKNKIISLVVSFVSFGLIPVSVYAQNLGVPRIPNPTRINSLEELINIALGFIRPLFIITFVLIVLYGAFVWMTAGDDDSKIQRARKIIVAAIIGLLIAIFAPVITNLVTGFLGVEGIQTT